MRGRRIQSEEFALPGDYWKDENGVWYAVSPVGLIACLENHNVSEHKDGTISVTPSILIRGYVDGTEAIWHGFLTQGVFTTA